MRCKAKQNDVWVLRAVKREGLMLEMIMKLNIPLYVMTSMGCIGGLGMLATNLTYRRMIRKNTEVK